MGERHARGGNHADMGRSANDVMRVAPRRLLLACSFTNALTSFVGRTAETRELAALVAEYRLVTVTGPGGVGKTRLAGEVARRAVSRFADGVWLVELASVADPAQVAAAVLAALGLPEGREVPPAQRLVTVMAGRQVLLVLDNCEHVLSAVTGLCRDLLAAADDMRILATSREPLGIPGEIRYRLGPLGQPSAGGPSQAEEPDAVALFAERARRATLSARAAVRKSSWSVRMTEDNADRLRAAVPGPPARSSPAAPQRFAERPAEDLAGGGHRDRVDHLHRLGDFVAG